LFVSKEVRKQVDDDEAEKKEDEKKDKADDAEIKDEGEDKKEEGDEEKKKEKKTKTVTEQVWEWETINEIKAIWLREKSEITDEEYSNFYKTISKDHESPLAYQHFSAEGEIEFKAILFIPS
jgi:HSP90 family molecular chaperone